MTWAQFKTAVRVYMPEHNRRQGIQSTIDATIASGCVDLQDAVECYKVAHVTEYADTDLTLDGYASVGDLPEGRITNARLVRVDPTGPTTDYCDDLTLRITDYTADMRCGKYAYNMGLIALDPMSGSFYVVPTVDENSTLILTWNGIQRTFVDGTEVPFNETAAQAVAEYTLARLVRQTEAGQVSKAQSHQASYNQLKRRLRKECRDKFFLHTGGNTL